jgi:thiol-disulfide isomerase/thioredoxin
VRFSEFDMKALILKIAAVMITVSLSFSAYALELNTIAPEFSLPKLGAVENSSLSQYRGKVVYIDFWASWCAPCRTSFPLLEKFYQAKQKQGFALLAINMDEEIDAAHRFLERYPASFEILRDAEARWADTYGVETMPTSFIIDKKGVIRHIHHGFAKDDMADIEKIVNQLLAEKG